MFYIFDAHELPVPVIIRTMLYSLRKKTVYVKVISRLKVEMLEYFSVRDKNH